MASAPLELARLGKWIERVPALHLDGERPTSRALASRLSGFWLPSMPVLYVGSSGTSLSKRVAAISATELGDRRPSSAGHWLHALTLPAGVRVWWATTDAPEEYEDALLAAFAASVPPDEAAALHDPALVLPFANLARPTGERKGTGLTGSLIPEPVAPPRPPTHVVEIPDGDAEGARGEPPPPKRRRTAVRTSSKAAASDATGPRAPDAVQAVVDPDSLTAVGAERMRAELDTLIRVRRPEVIGRIRAAKELGDLKENADYTAAREEQSFLEGRIQSLEARLRTATVIDAPVDAVRIGLGSTVTVEEDGEERSLTIVGSAESDSDRGPDLVGITGRSSPAWARSRGRRRDQHPLRGPALPGGRGRLSGTPSELRLADSAAGRIDQLVLDRVERGLRARGEPELAEDVRHIGPCGPLGDE